MLMASTECKKNSGGSGWTLTPPPLYCAHCPSLVQQSVMRVQRFGGPHTNTAINQIQALLSPLHPGPRCRATPGRVRHSAVLSLG